ncbi:MAG: O-antigen ligase domain-containing protein [Chloroflexi bacterium]|nr:MAG: O-antigen ligase domain-containing protein [Chloroflexota bacterium]
MMNKEHFDHHFRKIARVLVLGMPVFLVLGAGAADTALSLVAILFLVHSLVRHDWSWLGEAWVRVCLLVWGWLFVASAFAVDPGASLGTAVTWFRFFVFAAALQFWVMDREWLILSIKFTGLVVILVAIDAVIQYFWGQDLFGMTPPNGTLDRLTGPMRKMVVGMYVSKLMYLPLVAFLFWAVRKKRLSGILGVIVAFLVCATAVVLSGERTATVLMIVGLLVAALTLRPARRYLVIGSVATALLAGVLFMSLPNLVNRQLGQTLSTLHQLRASPYGQLWLGGISIGLRHPITGVGLKNFRLVCDDETQGALSEKDVWRCGTHPHNYYIQWFCETGIVGLMLFLLLMGTLVRTVWPTLSHENWWLGGIVATLAIHAWPLGSTGSFFNNWNSAILWFPFGLAVAGMRFIGPIDPGLNEEGGNT